MKSCEPSGKESTGKFKLVTSACSENVLSGVPGHWVPFVAIILPLLRKEALSLSVLKLTPVDGSSIDMLLKVTYTHTSTAQLEDTPRVLELE